MGLAVCTDERERSCVCILGVLSLPLSTILIFYFEIIPTVGYYVFFILGIQYNITGLYSI
jgi:hypothetical protein